jgi:hypothetical protein
MSTIIIKFETFDCNKIEYENLEIYELLTNKEKNIVRLIHINAENRKELKELGFK